MKISDRELTAQSNITQNELINLKQAEYVVDV